MANLRSALDARTALCFHIETHWPGASESERSPESKNMRPLPHPPGAENDEDSIEMVRGWIVDGQLEISLAAWVWADEQEEWGRLLGDAACHLADAIAEETGKNRDEVFRAISKSLIDQLQHPPDNLEGVHVDPVESV